MDERTTKRRTAIETTPEVVATLTQWATPEMPPYMMWSLMMAESEILYLDATELPQA